MIVRANMGDGDSLTDAAGRLLSNVGGRVSDSADKLDVGLTVAAYASVVAALASIISAIGTWRKGR
jgi:hypothetical protein